MFMTFWDAARYETARVIWVVKSKLKEAHRND